MDQNKSSLENIRRVEIFFDLNYSDLKKIDKDITWNSYHKGITILSHHEMSSDVYFISHGSVRATTYSISGKEISYQDLVAGEMFGELSAIDSKGRITSIITLEVSSIGKVSSQNFNEIIRNYSCINTKVMIKLTSLIRFLCDRIYEFSVLDVKDRIRAEIIRHAKENLHSENFAIILRMPTHEEIANKISTHREAVTKEFSHLTKLGLIEKSGRKIIVPDINKLAATLLEEV